MRPLDDVQRQALLSLPIVTEVLAADRSRSGGVTPRPSRQRSRRLSDDELTTTAFSVFT